MNNNKKILETLKSRLYKKDSVHAFWLEGSLADKDSDEYSDLDIWLSVDDDKIRSIHKEIEQILETINPIDFRFVLKPTGELGHNVYHLRGMSEFLTIDINTQKLSRAIMLTEDIDLYEIIFDKSNIVRTKSRVQIEFNKATELVELMKFIDYTALSVRKNDKRGKKMEAREYYRNILVHVLEYLRKKNGIHEKVDFGFKHTYKDIPEDEANKLEDFYFSNVTDGTIESLKSWLNSV